jgi:lysophospholipase L1-like esterase
MSATSKSKDLVPPHAPGFNTSRREVLIALSVAGMAAPLFGCGGGGGGGAAAPPPATTPPTPPAPPPPPPLDITPTATFDATATPGLTANYAYLTGSSAVNPAFTFSGAAKSSITQFGPALPRSNMVSAALASADTYSPGTLYTTFYHTGTTLDIIQYGFADPVIVYINDAFSARYGLALVSGTAQGGAAASVTLASTSSTISGYYNEYYVRIAGGTGVLNEVKQVTAYDGTTFIATVDSPWTTPPDATTQYVIQEGTQPFVVDGQDGLVRYLHFKWNVSGQRKITIEQGIFAGVLSDGTIAAAPTVATTPLLAIGDSFVEGDAAPANVQNLIDFFAASMNWLPTNLGQGGSGFVNPAPARLNFQDQIAPPAEAWRVLLTATGGNYTISVTVGGTTVTTAPLAANSTQAAIQSALNALSNVKSAGGSFNVARGDLSTPLIIVGHAITGATLSVDGTALTGGTISVLGAYMGDVAENLPTDSSGNALPFYLLVCGSGNDTPSSDAQVKAAATYVAQQITTRFPTAMAIFVGVLGDCGATSNLIGSADVSRNAALAAGAALLPMINGKVPFIDTYAAGVGMPKIINGLGTVANPTPGTNSNLKSVTLPGHPTGAGAQFLANWLATQVKSITG